MPFNPLEQQGIPLDKQLRNWSELNIEPYDKNTIHPYSRSRVIVMNGIEVEPVMFSHQFARHTDNMAIKSALALSRRVDQQQQKAINWLSPGDETPSRRRSATSRWRSTSPHGWARTSPIPT